MPQGVLENVMENKVNLNDEEVRQAAGGAFIKDGFKHDAVFGVKAGMCVSCGACGAARQAVVEARNGIGAQPGDHVRFTLPEHSVVLGSLIVFAVPLVLALACGVLGAWLDGGGVVASGTLGGLVGAAIGLAAGGLVVRWFDRRAAAQQPQIVEILR